MDKIEILSQIAKLLRIYSLKTTTEAGSGHPTSCMSIAEIISCLFFDEMKYNVNDPDDFGNDELVLSKGHAAPILWAAYAEAGIIDKKELMNLRKITGDLEGHPTSRMKWVKAATGSLGQGLSIGVGIALAMKLRNLSSRVYVILGDGECGEGAVWEACNSAAKYKLNNLCAIVDVNRLELSQETMHGHDINAYAKKFKAFGWEAITVDGHNIDEILNAFKKIKGNNKPSAIIAKTLKGKGVSFLENKDGWHGKILDKEKLEKALSELGDTPKVNAKKFVNNLNESKKPDISMNYDFEIKPYSNDDVIATRKAYGNALVNLGKINNQVIVIDADVKNSTMTEGFFINFPDRSFESHIAEQNMIGMAVGFSAKGFLPFAATFGAFLTRAYDFIRMASYSNSNIKIAGSHAGVNIGQDGPSQMGLEDIAMFRAIPKSIILYPSDGFSAEHCLKLSAEYKGISYLRTTRADTPVIYNKDDKFELGGSKVLKQSDDDKVLIVTAGITVFEALKAYDELKKQGINIRLIDAYSVKPIDKNGINKAVNETGNKLIVVEDHYEGGGLGDAVLSALAGVKLEFIHLCIRDLPRSGKPEELLDKYGISARCIVEAVRKLVDKR